MANTARFKVSGREGSVSFDLDDMRGDVLEVLEEHLGGDSVYVWLRRWVDAMTAGIRISEFRTRDIIGLVYLGSAQADQDITWQSVSRSIAPYTLEFLPDEQPPPAPPVRVGVPPDQTVPEPATASSPLNLSAIGVPTGAHEAAEPPHPAPGDFYRQP